jgi:type IV/VI secretion system ImpK/VasF family protein
MIRNETALAPARTASPAQPAAVAGFCLVDRFSEFYDEVIRQKRRITSGKAAPGDPAATAVSSSPWHTLLALLQEQAVAAEKAESAARYAPAQYLMAAFADEVFLGFLWPGRQAWSDNPLEKELFGTEDGATEVFDRIDDLDVKADLDLAKTYLLDLALGFRGRYRNPEKDKPEETAHPEAYRRRLYREIYGVEPGTIPGAGRLFPEAYLSTRSRGGLARLPKVRGWVLLFLTVLLGSGILAHVYWRQATAGLRTAVEKVLLLP